MTKKITLRTLPYQDKTLILIRLYMAKNLKLMSAMRKKTFQNIWLNFAPINF